MKRMTVGFLAVAMAVAGVRAEAHLYDISTEGRADVRIVDDEVTVTATEAVSFVRIRFPQTLPRETLVLNDAWERSYGELEWADLGATRCSPWYYLANDGKKTWGVGVETGPSAMCCWEVSTNGATLVLDLRAGGQPVKLGGRMLKACRIVRAESAQNESPWQFGRRFCKLMCPNPKLPKTPVYGYNDWYCAYGKNTATNFLADAAYVMECAKGCANTPYVVMDDGWQKNSPPVVKESGRGPWDAAGPNFGMDMPTFCKKIAALGAKPGLWYRPLRAWDELPAEQRLLKDYGYLDPTVPAVKARIAEDMARFRDWGFKLVKIDYLAYDISQLWPCDKHPYADRYIQDDRAWRDSSRTTAEVMLDLYKTMKDTAGDDVIIIGCNAINHLAAGVFELQRTGNDTSGKSWSWTKQNGVNTLAMRSIQDGAFFKIDADCVGLAEAGAVPWELNGQWMDLLGRSGTPFFVSWRRQLAGPEVRAALSKAFRRASSERATIEPLDWMKTRTPTEWKDCEGEAAYSWQETVAGSVDLKDWRFSRDGEKWEKVSVPHDWAIAGPFDKEIDKQIVRIVENQEEKATEKTGRTGSLPWLGRGEYRCAVDIPAGAEWASLVFSGAMSEPEVFCDGAKIGEWKYGYTPFEVELPVTSGRHEIAVKLNNRAKSSRWYPGAGLYRPVALRWGKTVGIKTWGQSLYMPDAETLVVKTELRNPRKAKASVSYRILDAAGKEVAAGDSPLKVPDARTWSPESPSLYTLETTVRVGDEVADVRRERFGFRTVEYGKGWFKLNGVARTFKGVCLHHDLGPLGAAFDGDAFRRQVLLLKEMGCDAIRTSHNIPAPEQLAICDELGMMVMAESFDAWELPKVQNGYNLWFKDWWRRDLTQLVLTARNHPSVVMWSIGNEVPDQTKARGAELTKTMQDFIHTLDPDPKRLVTQGASDMPAAIESGVIAAMEIPAVTYRLKYYEAIHAASPAQGMVLGVETASTLSSRGVYKFPDEPVWMKTYADGQCSGYDTEYCIWSNLPDDDWAMQDDHAWTIGEFVWTGFDYLGEPTPYDRYWPSRSSYFGIFDLAGLPKDRYWLYRSRWNTTSHTLHLVPHWTFPGREGQVTPVYCYTDFAEAELFVNGKSQGRRRKDPSTRLDRYRLRWRDVVYEPGELKVVAYDAAGKAARVETVRTAGAFARFEEKSMDVGRLRFVTVAAVDAKGTTCPDYDGSYAVKPPAGWRFKAICNGDATSLEPFVTPKMKLFKGQLVYVLERE